MREFLAGDYRGLVANLAVVTGSREEAEDAVEEALVRAWIKSERGEEIVDLRTWVGVVAINVARSRFRRLRVEARAMELIRAGTTAAGRGESQKADIESLLDVRRLLPSLPRRQREVVVLHYYLDLDLEGVARGLGVSVGTAKKALHRGRETLARAMAEDEEKASDVTN
jgi:RNA polymerase sigma factor (sigma-70 family)